MKLLICLFAIAASTMSESNVDLLKASNDQFTANLFQEVVKANPGKNAVLSAFSVLTPLAQLALASKGESHDELLKSIGLPNDDVTKAVFSDASKQLKSVKGVELNIANRIYIRKGEVLNEEYAVVSRDVFNSDVKDVDFSQNVATAEEINTWVENNTNHKIKDLVSPNMLDSTTAAVLVNAIYFKGKWKSPFDKNSTSNKPFHVSKDETILIPTMCKKSEDLKYGSSQELDAQLLELPYEGDQSSLLIVLPNQIDGINSLVDKLKDPSALANAVDNMYASDVKVELPTFKIETTTNLKEALEHMNVKKMFTPGDAQLVNLLKGQSDLYISAAIQKAYIDVNEEGAEAAAANDFGIAYLSAVIKENRQFKADHPFVFFLMEKNNIIFNGVFQS